MPPVPALDAPAVVALDTDESIRFLIHIIHIIHRPVKTWMRTSMADRLKARCQQLGLNAGQVAELAGVNRPSSTTSCAGARSTLTSSAWIAWPRC